MYAPEDGPRGPKHVGAVYKRDIWIQIVVFYLLINSAFVGKIILYIYVNFFLHVTLMNISWNAKLIFA
jgi:hypothetical protein